MTPYPLSWPETLFRATIDFAYRKAAKALHER
jgi:hypothetical protein